MVFTAVEETRFRPIAKRLVEDDYTQPWFADIEYIQWQGPVKDLRFIPAAQVGDVLLVEECVCNIGLDPFRSVTFLQTGQSEIS